MKLVPHEDWMLLELIETNKVSLAMPDSYKPEEELTATFRVLAVGPGHYVEGKFHTPQVAVGDRVMITNYGQSKFEWEGKKVFLGRARDVVFTVSEV